VEQNEKRWTIEKHEYSSKREQEYRKKCEWIAKRRGEKLPTPTDSKHFWYETWLRLEYGK